MADDFADDASDTNRVSVASRWADELFKVASQIRHFYRLEKILLQRGNLNAHRKFYCLERILLLRENLTAQRKCHCLEKILLFRDNFTVSR